MLILVRGGGDLASGVTLRLHRSGFQVLIAELPQPLVVRRLVSFAEAVFRGEMQVEEAVARRAEHIVGALSILKKGMIPVLVDPDLDSVAELQPEVLVDGRMRKAAPELGMEAAPLVIGLGPGFTAGENCHAVIETNRGHLLGRVVWKGSPEADTGIPESVLNRREERVLRSPADGELITHAEICDHLKAGQVVADVDGEMIYAPFQGVLRGILHSGVHVQQGLKIGDIDPRDDPSYCTMVSDKSLAVGGGVLEAILSRPDLRDKIEG